MDIKSTLQLIEEELDDFDFDDTDNKFDDLEMLFMEMAIEVGVEDPTLIFPLIARFKKSKTYKQFGGMTDEQKNKAIKDFIAQNT